MFEFFHDRGGIVEGGPIQKAVPLRWTMLEPPARYLSSVVRVESSLPGLYDLRTIRVEVARSIAG